MSVLQSPAPQIDIFECLRGQNLYQRLGLRTNNVSAEDLRSAYRSRLELLEECIGELGEEEMEEVRLILADAHDRLADPSFRERYDRQLGSTANQVVDQITPPSTPNASTLILGRYRLEHLVESGDRWDVFAAQDTRLVRSVIVKQLNQKIRQSPDARNWIEKESSLFARFNSINLVKLLDADVATGCIVLERMENNLEALQSSKACDGQTAIDVLRDCLTGLSALHGQGVSHGRIEAKHILIDNRGAAKLSLSAGVISDQDVVKPGSHAKHIAPEYLNPTVFGKPGFSGDVYALGFVILELLSGRSFPRRVSPSIAADGGTQNAWLQWHASPTDHLPSIDELIPELPTGLVHILQKMTCKQQQERYSSAEGCLADLKKATQSSEATNPSALVSQSVAPDDYDVQLLGAPDPLHAAYQTHASVSWSEVIKNPACLLTPEGKKHRTLVFFVGTMAATLLLLVVSTRAPSDNVLSSQDLDSAATPSQELPATTSGAYEPSQPQLLASDPIASINDVALRIPPAMRDASEDPPSAEVSIVYFELPADGTIASVISVDEEDIESLIDEDGRPYWELKAGQYRIQYEVGQLATNMQANIRVPEESKERTWKLPAPATGALSPPAIQLSDSDNSTSENEPVPLDHLYKAPKFHDQNRERRSAQEGNQLLIKEIQRFVSKNVPESQARAIMQKYVSTDLVYDPRESFSLAVRAYQIGDSNLAIQLCEKSIKDSTSQRTPFVLPTQFASHIHMKHNNFKEAVHICRDTIAQLGLTIQQSDNSNFSDALEDMSWWTGMIAGGIESRPIAYRAEIDLDGLEGDIRRASDSGRHLEIYVNAVESAKRRYYELETGYIDNVGGRLTEKDYDRDKYQLYRERNRREQQRKNARPGQELPSTPEVEWSLEDHRSYHDKSESGKLGLETDLDSKSGIDSYMGPRPDRGQPVGVVSSPKDFLHIKPLDINQYYRWMLYSIPREVAPVNKKPAGLNDHVASNGPTKRSFAE